MLQSRPPDRAWEGVNHFCGEVNLSSHLQNLAQFLQVGRTKQPPTEFCNFCRSAEENSLPQNFAISVGRSFHVLRLQKFATEISFFCFLLSFLSVPHKEWPNNKHHSALLAELSTVINAIDTQLHGLTNSGQTRLIHTLLRILIIQTYCVTSAGGASTSLMSRMNRMTTNTHTRIIDFPCQGRINAIVA